MGGWDKIELRGCEIAGLPNAEAKEGQAYRFRRRELERCLPDIGSSFYAERGLSLKAAITLLESKPKTATGKITLSADETETLRRAFQENRILQEKLADAACHVYGLLAVIDEAGALYREGKRSPAAMKVGWTSGKRGRVVPHADIFVNYLLMTFCSEPGWKTKDEAVDILTTRYEMQSREATIKSLQRTLASIRKRGGFGPHVLVDLPNAWPKDKVEKPLKSKNRR